MSFYILLFLLVIIALLIYGASLTNVFEHANRSFGQMFLHAILYLAFWSIIYFFILLKGESILGNTLKMSAVYLFLAFIVPAAVHQLLSIKKPANLMTDFIDIRDKRQELFNEPDSIYQAKLVSLFPKILKSPVYQDSTKIKEARNSSASALVNEINKAIIEPIEEESQVKNAFIESTFWFNPVSFFQNRLNAITRTHFDDYQKYRDEIQILIDKQIRMMVLDMWNGVNVDESRYRDYSEALIIE